MKPHDDVPSDEQLDAEAAAWLCEREEGFPPARAQAFATWCAQPRHAAAARRVGQALALLAEMPAVRVPLEARVGSFKPASAPRKRGDRVAFPMPVWVAALAAAVIFGFLLWWMPGQLRSTAEHFATEGATQRRVTLRDGSVIDLNGGSAVDVQFVGRQRRVTLRSGEAHFQVAPDKARPFIVSAGGVSVRAVGTAFNVQLAAAEVSVLVTEGTVHVQHVAASQPATTVSAEAAAAAVLTVNERTVFPVSPTAVVSAPPVERVSPEQIRALLAWQNPVTTFYDTPLREVVAQFNRRNTLQLTLEDATLAERRIGGVIALDQVEALVRLLEQDGEIVASPRGTNEIVLQRAR